MGIINRSLSESERRTWTTYTAGALATGVTSIIDMVPWPCSVDQASFQAFGISGSPTVQILCTRFVPGAGATVFNLGSTVLMQSAGTSGIQGFSLPQIGTTLSTLLAGDVLSVQIGGTTSAVTGLAFSVVLRPIGDVLHWFSL